MAPVGIRVAHFAVSALIIHPARYFHIRESNIISSARHTSRPTKWTVIAFHAVALNTYDESDIKAQWRAFR